MAGKYGARLADAWQGVDPEIVKAEWGKSLSQLTVDQLKRGIDGLDGCKWPPMLPEFIALCKTAPPASHSFFPKLSAPGPTPEQKEKMLAELHQKKVEMGWTA